MICHNEENACTIAVYKNIVFDKNNIGEVNNFT